MNYSRPLAAFFDLDGTLARNNQPPLSADTAAIRAFRSAGNSVFLCTGRSSGYLYDAVTDIGFDGVVAAAGAHITLNGSLLFRRFVEPDILEPILTYFETAEQTLILENETGMVQLASDAASFRVPSYPRIRTAAEWHEQYFGVTVSKLTVYGKLSDSARSLIENRLTLIVHPRYYEALPCGCGKADGMRRVLESIGIPRENSLAFGDSANDMDMLRYAGLGVAMGNADPEVKALADRITLSYDQAGVSHILNEIRERQASI